MNAMKLDELICKYYKNEECIYFYICLLAGVSVMLENAQICYPHPQHLQLYLAILGKAGSKKSVVSDVKRCFAEIQKERVEEWRALDPQEKSKKMPNLFFIPANSSSSAIIECISQNKGTGIIWESEIETLSSILSTDYGNFSDVIRNNFHEESISLCRRSEHEYIECLNPHISVILAGTYLQAKSLFRGGENGLFSRFLFFNIKEKQEWINLFSTQKEQEEMYDYTNSLLHVIQSNKMNVNMINFSDKIKKEHESIYSELLSKQKRDFMFAVIKRRGLIHLRLSALIEVINRIEKGEDLSNIIVSDYSFELAQSIMTYSNSEVAYDLMNYESEDERERKRNMIYYQLPPIFSISDMGEEVSLATKYRYIQRWLQKERIEKIKDGWRKL